MLRVAFTITLWAAVSCAEFVNQPTSVVYKQGVDSTGYVACKISPPNLNVIWNIQLLNVPHPQVIYSSPSFFNDQLETKYSINTDASSTGNYSLIIHNLERGDSGRYTCQVSSLGTQAANVTVADPPGIPVITAPSVALRERVTSTFSCESEGGFPAAAFTWLLADTRLSNTAHTDSESAGVSKSVLPMELSYSHHGALLTCVSHNILSSTNSSIVLNVQYKPRLTLSHTELIIMRGEPFQLMCTVTANPAVAQKQWLTEDGNVVSTSFFGNGVLDDTKLKCRAENSLGVTEETVQITVHYQPTVLIREGNAINVSESSEIRLTCDVDAKPAAGRVEWYRGNQLIKRSAELIIASVTKQHSGKYRCEATNNPTSYDGTSSSFSDFDEVFVNVQYGPKQPTFEVSPADPSGEYRAKERVVMKCIVQDLGNPAGIIRWYKTNQSDPLGAISADLILDNPQVSDGGTYWCQVENTISSAISNRLTIKFADVPQLWSLNSSKETNVSIGTINHQLQCAYRGFPTPEIYWYKDSKAISGDMGLYTVESDTIIDVEPYRRVTSTLKFAGKDRESGLMVNDFARYSCIAYNSVGKSKLNYEIHLNVLFSPKFSGFSKAATELGLDVEINCLVLSYPPVTSIQFFRGGNLIEPNSKYSFSISEYNVGNRVYQQKRSLKVISVSAEDYGDYRCETTNALGTEFTDIKLIKTSVPDPPTGLVSTNVTWGSVTLSWTAAFDGGFIQAFTAEEITENKLIEGIKETQFTFQGLSPLKTYKFRVYSINERGSSGKSQELSVTTLSIQIPPSTLVFDEKSMTVKVNVNSTAFCTKLQGSLDGQPYEDVSGECILTSKEILVRGLPYTSYRVATCVVNRPDICNESSSVAAQTSAKNNQKVVIGVVVSVFLVLLIVVVIIAVIILRKKRQNPKSAGTASKSGHINPILTPNGVPGEVHYSHPNQYNINSDLDEDEIDAIPYGEFKNSKAESPVPAQQMQNLDYVYASVQKKSSEQNKMNEAVNATYQSKSGKPNNLNILVSDNSEAIGYDEQPPSPYRSPNDLAFLGDGVMSFHRYPSMSESGYSTPDSKQLKKVVYEVIV